MPGRPPRVDERQRVEAGLIVGLLMKYTVYVLSSTVVNKSYIGFTNDLDRRLKEHNTG